MVQRDMFKPMYVCLEFKCNLALSSEWMHRSWRTWEDLAGEHEH